MEPIFPANPAERVGFYGGRITEGFFGEPLNVASDICFVILILLYFTKLKKDGFSDGPVLVLVFLAGLVGLGSTLFHSHPTKITLQTDLIPITIFGLAYISFSARRFFNQTYLVSFLAPMVFLIATLGFKEVFKGSRIPGLNHIPSVLALVIIGLLLLRSPLTGKIGKAFMIASGCYLVGLFFRYLDFYVYKIFPLGTHFLWHALTFCVVIILLQTAVNYGTKGQGNRQREETCCKENPGH
jgi:hypothetical protein